VNLLSAILSNGPTPVHPLPTATMSHPITSTASAKQKLDEIIDCVSFVNDESGDRETREEIDWEKVAEIWSELNGLEHANEAVYEYRVDRDNLLAWLFKTEQAPVDLCESMLTTCPELAKHKDDHGYAALHLAAYYNATMDIVEALLKEYPDAVKEKDENGWTPFHCGMLGGASLEVVEALINVGPDAAKEKNNFGETPLMVGMVYGASLDVVKAVLKAWPGAAKEKANGGHTPLHDAVQNYASLEVLGALLRAHPDGAKEKDNRGRTPVHVAMENGASLEVVDALLKACPGSAKEKDNEGITPMMIGMETPGASWELVEAVQYPGAAKEKDNHGWTPLHYGMGNGGWLEGVDEILKESPDAAKEIDNNGSTPLHCAMQMCCSLEVVESLLKVYPGGLRAAEKGHSPLHYAFMNGVEIKIEKLIMKRAWEQVRKEGRDELEIPEGWGSNACAQLFVDKLYAMDGKHRGKALKHPAIRDFLNHSFISDSVIMVLMLTFYAQVVLIGAFSFGSAYSIEHDGVLQTCHLVFIIVPIVILLFLEVTQMYSSVQVSPNVWIDKYNCKWSECSKEQKVILRRQLFWENYMADFWNWVEISQIALITTSVIIMKTSDHVTDSMRVLNMVTSGLVWFSLIKVLKNFFFVVALVVFAMERVSLEWNWLGRFRFSSFRYSVHLTMKFLIFVCFGLFISILDPLRVHSILDRNGYYNLCFCSDVLHWEQELVLPRRPSNRRRR
jgi:ankyrin repeat protein